uniref:Uncharacterized protein n=1 Tax=Sphaerodactylus townsendi TaxID=933632 RepID=A0ACB8GCD2_9SAUR
MQKDKVSFPRVEASDMDAAKKLNVKMLLFLAGSWLDHVEGWYAHKDDFNILFLTYEEMKKDLRNSVLKICSFLGRKLTEEELQTVVDMATFDKMRLDPRSNYEKLPVNVMDKDKGCFLRKGTVGDWKNIMTIAQSERFDSVFRKRMESLPVKFCWDINEDLPS